MVSLLVLSHSKKLAEGVKELAGEMSGGASIYAVGGTKEGALGSDFDATFAALSEAADKGEVIVLADMGSTRMTAQMALEALDEDAQKRVYPNDAALVEGSVLAAVSMAAGMEAADILEQLKDFKLDK